MAIESDQRLELAKKYGIDRLEIPNGLSHWIAIAEIPQELGQVAVIDRLINVEGGFRKPSDLVDKSPDIWVPQQNILELLSYPQVQAKVKSIQQLNGAHQVVPVAIDKNLVAVVEANDYHIPGFTWRHERSKARYFMISKNRSPGVRGYKLEGEEETSDHWHLKRLEIARLIWGEAEIEMDGVSFEMNGPVEIPLGVKHRIRAKNKGAVLVVVTLGPGDCLSMDDHHYHSHSQGSFTP